MREIKFRAWDKKSKKIREVISIIYTNASFDYMDYQTFNEIKLVYLKGRDMIHKKDIQISRKKSECDLMQYTGLKDKNGKEIYERDLLYDGNRLFRVTKDNRKGKTGYIMHCINNKSEKDHIKVGSIYEFWSWLDPDNNLEVVGNVHQQAIRNCEI